jgi:hypothetical protein
LTDQIEFGGGKTKLLSGRDSNIHGLVKIAEQS